MIRLPASFWVRLRPWMFPLLAIVCSAGMWSYVNRVLIPHQVSDAVARHHPRGNFSDLYPRWLGAKELLLRGRDPYSPEVSREIQAGYYGRPLDPSRPGDPRDEQGFAYPVYVVFLLSPTIGFPFAIVQKCFFWMLVFLTSASTLLWLRVLRWSAPPWIRINLLVLTLGSLAVMQGLKLQQISLLVAGLVAVAIAFLVTDHMVAAGVLLAAASVKPQLVWLLLCWLAVWTLADWRRRYPLAVSFLATMTILLVASEWYLPHWIPRFWHAVREYQRYTETTSVMESLMGTPWSWVIELSTVAAMMLVWWTERRQAANSDAFAFTLGLTLTLTILLVPTDSPYNQVLLIPAVLLLVKERWTIWQRSFVSRILFTITAGLIFWPWIASVALAVSSFVLPQQKVEQAWAVPFWTVTQIPVGVAALMLVHYYQDAFGASARSATS